MNRRVTNSRQRKKQHYLLDVKVRSTTERRRRIGAIISITCRLVLVVGLVAGSWIGGKEALRRYLWENPDYFIRDPAISTDGTLNREQILRASGIVEGSNIFLINLGQARAAIEKLPQVERAEVTRTLPNRLAILITERQPIAWLVSKPDEDPTASDKSFLIDAHGMVMKSKVRLEEYLSFPTISGIPTENLVPGERVTLPEMTAALELIRLTSASTRFQPRHIDVAKGYCLVITDHKRAKITFGLEGIEKQLARLQRYMARAAEDFREIQTINLIVERNTPVTFFEPLPLEPAPTDDAAVKAAETRSRFVAATGARATPAATPVPSKIKSTPTPAARKSGESVKKKPFRLNH